MISDSRTQENFLDEFLNAENVWAQRKERNAEKLRSRGGRAGRFLADMKSEAEIPIEPYEGERNPEATSDHHKLSRRSILSLILLLMVSPALIAFGIFFLDDRKYLFISIVLLLLAMLPFFMVFEGRKPQARELVVIAVLTALTIASRAALFMLPNVKPISAMVIISGVTFGPEAGFLVGSLSMLLSNFMFGQGPWTPWQMFTYGVIGFLAGTLFRKGLLKRTRPALCFYGFMSVIFIFGGIMNFASLIMYTSHFTWAGLLAMYVSGFPVDLIHAASTVVFLWFGARPLIEKLERVKKKYGLIRTGE